MKNIFKSFMALTALVVLMASCAQEINKADYDYQPEESQKGFSFMASSQGGTYMVGYEDTVYHVGVYRNYTEGEEVLHLTYSGNVDAFNLPESVTFEDGVSFVTIPVNIGGIGPGNEISFGIAFNPDSCLSYYSYDSVAIMNKLRKDSAEMVANSQNPAAIVSIMKGITAQDTVVIGGEAATEVELVFDYTWVSKGVVLMSSQWEGKNNVEVVLEQAKEYSDAEGNHYMRLNSPYYHIAPDYCAAPGKHAYFYLDRDYNAGNDLFIPGIQEVEDDYAWYWHPNYVGSYLSFRNQANMYAVQILWLEVAAGSLTPGAVESWVWDEEHYNAALADPNWVYED